MSEPWHAAAAVLWNAWASGQALPGLPSRYAPGDLDDAYAIQTCLDRLAGPKVGWKIAATGAGGQAVLGVDHPLAGPLYARFATEPGGEVDFEAFRMRTIEAEFGFVMRGPLKAAEAPFDRGAVLAALGAFVPAIEVPNTRYLDHRAVGGPQLVADAACAGTFVLGEPVEDYDPGALPSHRVELSAGASEPVEGTGERVLGDPVEAVRWLANELASRGQELAAGEAVITGAAAPMRDPGPGLAVADFGALGSVSISLS